jgi:formylglycine-generating enzyme required for sulfatase activity
MGVKNNTVVLSKLGVTPATAFDSATKYWYGLYSKAKTYTTSSVQSSMIWGSQYDAMLNFALTGADKAKVVATTNGNHGGTQTKTGAYKGSDCINNIYDLEGNEWEWTLEAYNSGGRDRRGGNFVNAVSPSFRGKNYPYDDNFIIGSRATLYIK